MAAAGLEARYRRLLGWFPADHRAVHGEEMLGVLMAGADDDRDKPGVPETADLLLGAARIRLRPGRALSDRDGWRDALAMFSVAGPVLVLATVSLVYLVQLVTSLLQGNPPSGSFGLGAPSLGWSALSVYYGQASAIPWLVLSGQGLVVLLALLGLRRSAAAATVLSLAAIIHVQGPYPGLGILTGPVLLRELFLLVLPVAQIVALLASPGPRRGRELLRGRHWALLAVAAVAAAALTAAFLPAIVAARPPFRVLAWLPGYGLTWGPGGGGVLHEAGPISHHEDGHCGGADPAASRLAELAYGQAAGGAVRGDRLSGARNSAAPLHRLPVAVRRLLGVRGSADAAGGPRTARRVRAGRDHVRCPAPGPVVRQRLG
jgi:hypothetical protein